MRVLIHQQSQPILETEAAEAADTAVEAAAVIVVDVAVETEAEIAEDAVAATEVAAAEIEIEGATEAVVTAEIEGHGLIMFQPKHKSQTDKRAHLKFLPRFQSVAEMKM